MSKLTILNPDALRQICGVSQGSVLGSINDLPTCSSSNGLEFILFADDTSIFFEHSDLDVLTSHLNDQLHNVSTWLKANKLLINVNDFQTKAKNVAFHKADYYRK